MKKKIIISAILGSVLILSSLSALQFAQKNNNSLDRTVTSKFTYANMLIAAPNFAELQPLSANNFVFSKKQDYTLKSFYDFGSFLFKFHGIFTTAAPATTTTSSYFKFNSVNYISTTTTSSVEPGTTTTTTSSFNFVNLLHDINFWTTTTTSAGGTTTTTTSHIKYYLKKTNITTTTTSASGGVVVTTTSTFELDF